MIKSILIQVILLTPVFAFGQSDFTQIKIRENENPRYKEVFLVLKSDTSVKHGDYKRLGYNNETILFGKYNMGRRDSLWTEYVRFSKKTISKGYYFDDKKIGVWEYFDINGFLCYKYDYNSKQKIFSLYDKEGYINEMFVIQDSSISSLRLQREPFFNGTEEQLWAFLRKNIQYSSQMKAKGVVGTVYVSFIIDKNGRTGNYKIVRGVNEEFDNEALRVVKSLPNDWIPGMYEGAEVATLFQIPIKFPPK